MSKNPRKSQITPMLKGSRYIHYFNNHFLIDDGKRQEVRKSSVYASHHFSEMMFYARLY